MEERERPGLPQWWFLLVVFLLGAGMTALTITLGALRSETTDAEQIIEESGGVGGLLVELFGQATTRVFAGVLAGGTVVATGFVARRFTHSAGVGVLAAVLVSLDPAMMVDGQLAIPATLLRFAAVSALALALGGHPVYHWLVPVPIIVGWLLEPWFLLWGAAIVALMLLRGHIFAAPKHLRNALFQGLGIPLLVGVPLLIAIHQTSVTQDVVCSTSTARSLLLLDVPQYGDGLVAVANPVVAIGGLGLLAALAIGALVQLGTSFRLARLPGRVQIRLPQRLGRIPSRVLWLSAFALAMPTPEVAIIMGAFGIALGVQALIADSPVFATVVGVLIAVFAAAVVVRLAPIIAGDASADTLADVLQWLPWVDPVACSGGATA